jgi:hypothetical protein
MSERTVGAMLSLARQTVALGFEFGTHSLEALLWVAETVENSVYEAGSLVREGDGIAFALLNPPLRTGAFQSVRLSLDGQLVDPSRLRLRPGPGRPWQSAASISRETPFTIRPGQRTEVAGGTGPPVDGRPMDVRLELESVAIPPLVWLEFRDIVREPRSP